MIYEYQVRYLNDPFYRKVEGETIEQALRLYVSDTVGRTRGTILEVKGVGFYQINGGEIKEYVQK